MVDKIALCTEKQERNIVIRHSFQEMYFLKMPTKFGNHSINSVLLLYLSTGGPWLVRFQLVQSPVQCDLKIALNSANPKYSAIFVTKIKIFYSKSAL